MGPRKAMVFAATEVTNIDKIADDPMMVIEQKLDGTRSMCVIQIEGEGDFNENAPMSIEFLSRSGATLKHSAATQHLGPIKDELALHVTALLMDGHVKVGDEIVIDGELMIDTGMYILFDMPYLTGYLVRRAALAEYFYGIDKPVTVNAMAQSPDEKRWIFDQVMANNGEGVMAKHINAPFDEGKRVKHSLKLKFYRTADVVVMDFYRGRDGKNAAGEPTGSETGWIKFGVYNDEGVIEHLGRCSIIGKPAVANGDVIEVKYLYRGAGGALVQPTMLRNREDRTPESCTYEQFQVYSKALL